MEALKGWAVSVCAVVIIASIVSMIVPNIHGKNIMRLIISGFILLGIFSSFFSSISKEQFYLDFLSASNDDAYSSSDGIISDDIMSNIEDNVAQALYPLIQGELKSCGLEEDFGVRVKLTAKNNSLELESVHITTSTMHKISMDSLKNELEEKLGIKIHVDVIKAEEN